MIISIIIIITIIIIINIMCWNVLIFEAIYCKQ